MANLPSDTDVMIDSQRYPRLSRIQVPADLRQFPEEELPAIADELRAYLIEQVALVGGHFGAGLGVIELTVALHWLYETPVDYVGRLSADGNSIQGVWSLYDMDGTFEMHREIGLEEEVERSEVVKVPVPAPTP